MNLQHLYYFRELAQTLHYTEAAKKLFITQPSLSYAIQSLEKELGVGLFTKGKQALRLSGEGELFYRHVVRALDELDEGRRELDERIKAKNQVISLAFIYTLGTSFVPDLVSGFEASEKNGKCTFKLQHGNTETLLASLKARSLELAFCSYVENEPDIEFVPCIDQRLVLITPKNHPLSEFEEIDLADALPYPLVHFIKECAMRRFIDAMFESIGGRPIIACETETDLSVASFVASGAGIAVIPYAPVIDTLGVEVRPISNPEYRMYIYLAYLKNSELSPATARFRDYVLANHQIDLERLPAQIIRKK